MRVGPLRNWESWTEKEVGSEAQHSQSTMAVTSPVGETRMLKVLMSRLERIVRSSLSGVGRGKSRGMTSRRLEKTAWMSV